MFIDPMKTIGSFEKLKNIQPIKQNHETEKAAAADGSMFQDVFKNAISEVINTDQNLTEQQYLLSTGQIDDAHTVPIAAAQAQLSVDMLVQLRNKALESYNELIRLNI